VAPCGRPRRSRTTTAARMAARMAALLAGLLAAGQSPEGTFTYTGTSTPGLLGSRDGLGGPLVLRCQAQR
jgi:hypothetical protein